ncbi:MAG TPA: hypothetical protein VN758_11190 [Solirubrobacterales bacterium]|nr:hypothetical protein [Solirubrobacterales bacterium]
MVDRLRALLEEPLDPRVGRAIVVLASAILLGLAALFILAARQSETSTRAEEPPAPRSASGSATADLAPAPTPEPPVTPRRQDPQDQEGSAAARRAARALASHRALQHVPYLGDELEVELVGARGHKAVLRVTADTVQAARAGWRRFLRRYLDSGRAYLPIFRGELGERSG